MARSNTTAAASSKVPSKRRPEQVFAVPAWSQRVRAAGTSQSLVPAYFYRSFGGDSFGGNSYGYSGSGSYGSSNTASGNGGSAEHTKTYTWENGGLFLSKETYSSNSNSNGHFLYSGTDS